MGDRKGYQMYLLSVIIPTKNRYQYLRNCLLSLVELNSDNVEIIVQDNTVDNQEIVGFVDNLNWPHLKYFHDSSDLSQTENSDLALSHTTGKYCTYIGDDDSITQAAIEATKFMDNNNLLACVNNMATYYWNDVVFKRKEKPVLTFDDRQISVCWIESSKVLKQFLSHGCENLDMLPRVYHGIIHRDILELIKSKTGSYFPGPSPDMANAVCSLLLLDKYVYIRLPLIVSGFSYKSAGGMGLRGAHNGSINDAKQLPRNAAKEWNDMIPELWLGCTVWPESAIKAFSRMGFPDLINKINYAAVYAETYVRFPSSRELVLSKVKVYGRYLSFVYESIRFVVDAILDKMKISFRRLKKTQYDGWEKITLIDACRIVNDHNKKNGINYFNYTEWR